MHKSSIAHNTSKGTNIAHEIENWENEEADKETDTVLLKGTAEEKGKKEMKEEKAKSVSVFALWKYSTKRNIYLVISAVIFSVGAGVLTPLVTTVVGDLLDRVGASSFFFSLSRQELEQYLEENNKSCE